MSLWTSKWLISLYIILAILVVLYIVGRKSVHSEVLISAPVDQVWSVLMDTEKYNEWNEVLVLIEGRLEQSAKVKYMFTQDPENSYEISSTVKAIIENQILNQGGGMPGVLSFDHRYILEPDANGTKVIIHEDYRGIGVPFWNPAPVEKAYNKLIQALKDRVIKVNTDE